MEEAKKEQQDGHKDEEGDETEEDDEMRRQRETEDDALEAYKAYNKIIADRTAKKAAAKEKKDRQDEFLEAIGPDIR